MSVIVVERSFAEPADYAELQRREDAAEWCRNTHQVQFRFSVVANDSKHIVCCYEAVDAESVRGLQRKAELPVDHLWTATTLIDINPQGPEGFSIVVAQRSLPKGVTQDMIQHMIHGAKGCHQRLRLHYFKSFVATDLKRMCCVFYAPDAESVRLASREIGAPYERVWSGRCIAAGA